MLKKKNQIIPLVLFIVGTYAAIIPYFLRFSYEILHDLMSTLSVVCLIAGIILYSTFNIQKRLLAIEGELGLSKENKISNLKFISTESNIEIIEHLKRNRFVYKASIYLHSSDMSSLFFLKSILESLRIDAKTRIVLSNSDVNPNTYHNIQDIVRRHSDTIDLKIATETDNFNFSIIILDTNIWILNSFGKEIKNTLVFSMSSYDEQGKQFIDLFNKIWNTSEIFRENEKSS